MAFSRACHQFQISSFREQGLPNGKVHDLLGVYISSRIVITVLDSRYLLFNFR